MSEDAKGHWIVARDKPGLLLSLMRALVGNAHISFEGDLSHCQFSAIPGSSSKETQALRQCVLDKSSDFIVCPLNNETIDAIWRIASPAGKLTGEIWHVQIEQHGQLAFGAYDNFDRNCTFAWSLIPKSLIEMLVASGVIRSFEQVDEESVSKRVGA